MPMLMSLGVTLSVLACMSLTLCEPTSRPMRFSTFENKEESILGDFPGYFQLFPSTEPESSIFYLKTSKKVFRMKDCANNLD
jgi:hypothetical protein